MVDRNNRCAMSIAAIVAKPRILSQMIVLKWQRFTDHDRVRSAIARAHGQRNLSSQAIEQSPNLVGIVSVAVIRAPGVAPLRHVAILLVEIAAGAPKNLFPQRRREGPGDN